MVVAVRGVVVVAIGHAAVGCVVVPRPTAQHTVLTSNAPCPDTISGREGIFSKATKYFLHISSTYMHTPFHMPVTWIPYI